MAPGPALTSRHGEDFLLLHAFAWQKRGFYLDVGAFDGVYGSNTWALEQLGWTGVCVEPAPEVFSLLTANRPSAACINADCGAEEGTAMLSMDPTIQFRSREAIEHVRSAFEESVEFRGLESGSFSNAEVDVVTLSDLLRRARPRDGIDLLTIDASGVEHEVLSGLDLTWYRPRLILLTAKNHPIRHKPTKQLEEAGYHLCRTVNESMFFTAESDLARRLSNTAINCYMPRNLHPLGLAYTQLPLRNDRVLLHGQEYVLEEIATQVPAVSEMNHSQACAEDV